MTTELLKQNQFNFEEIKHLDENGTEYWYARELMVMLEYSKWGNFVKVVDKAKESCKNSNISVLDHFADASKTIKMPKGAKKNIADFKLTRYACYLIAQNGDSKKEQISLAQTYFAIQTRKQELTEEEYNQLPEDEKRMYNRQLVKDRNKTLYVAAQNSGVKNYGKFTNYGYKGLYNGETEGDIHKRKGLSNKENILDYMGNEELGANIFRITQTEAKLKNDNIDSETDACLTHFTVGKTVRKAIEELGGTMPEALPTPKKSIKQIEKETKVLRRLNSKKSNNQKNNTNSHEK